MFVSCAHFFVTTQTYSSKLFCFKIITQIMLFLYFDLPLVGNRTIFMPFRADLSNIQHYV